MKIVFTIVLGGYDDLKPVREKNPDWRYIAIVDDLSIEKNGWDLLHISKLNPPGGLNNVYLQRWDKVIGAVEFFKCDTLYIDGTHEVLKDVTRLFGSRICFKKHPVRNCIYKEAEACIRLKKAHTDSINAQMKEYAGMGMPEGLGMFETGILFRPYTEEVYDFCKRWWSEISRHTHRDQLSVTKVMWDTKITFDWLYPGLVDKYITIHKHKACATI